MTTPTDVDVVSLNGRDFGRFVAAGTYFLRKYRGVLNDLNVYPVPDGDTGSNMYLTARAALAEANRAKGDDLSAVAAAAARGSLLGARGNSGVIFSQMLRGFAHTVRHRGEIDTLDLGIAMREAVGTARAALVKPVEGTMISVATAAADAAYKSAQREDDFLRVAQEFVRAAADAVERTPEQLPVLKEAGVVDSGGAGVLYFLEGILRFLPEEKNRATRFPRRPSRKRSFTSNQSVTKNKFCTEFVLEDARIELHDLRDALLPRGESLLVVGEKPLFKVHIHTADPQAVKEFAAGFGTLTREKVDNMEHQHELLVVDVPAKPFSVVAVVPGPGFAQISRELGAESVIEVIDADPSVGELVVAVNAALADRVYLLANDPNVVAAAKEVIPLCRRELNVIPTRNVIAGLAVQMALAGQQEPLGEVQLMDAARSVKTGSVFFAGKESAIGGVALKRGAPAGMVDDWLTPGSDVPSTVEAVAEALGARDGGLLTLYYGGKQKEQDARALCERLLAAFPGLSVEYYFGGQYAGEYLISRER
jgi:DAK2 domain fusion protein YloV